MALVKADRFKNLKSRVKAECLRRAHSGSVASYGGSAYDYSAAPASGGIARQEHRDKIAAPLNAINSSKVPNASGQKVVQEGNKI